VKARRRYPTEGIEFEGLDIDDGMMEMLGLQMAQGRPFSGKFGSDSSSVIFNETAVPFFSDARRTTAAYS
jgi:hypothetical protein